VTEVGGAMMWFANDGYENRQALEALCLSRIARLQRKLAGDSPLFVRERLTLLLQWDQTLRTLRGRWSA
jgi:hypothetical protein